jgi:hypothetical protein
MNCDRGEVDYSNSIKCLSVRPSARHTSTEPPERAPQQQGARGGGVCPDVRLSKPPRAISTTTRAITPCAVRWRLPDAGALWLLRTFYPCRCDAGTKHPKLVLEAWKRVPPSPPRFLSEPGLFDGDAHQLVARGGPCRRAWPLYATWPFTIAPSGITPCSTYRQSAMSSLRANATIPMRRSRRLPRPNFSSYQRVSVLVGW